MSTMRSTAARELETTRTISEKADTTVQQLIFDSVVLFNNHKTWLAWFNDYTVLQRSDAIDFENKFLPGFYFRSASEYQILDPI